MRTAFGSAVRRARYQAGLSVDELSAHTDASSSLVSKVERGTRGAKKDLAEELGAALGQEGALVVEWSNATAAVSMPDWTRLLSLSEERAIEIHGFGPLVIPGLLQTSDYAREILRYGESKADREALVAARTKRMGALSADLSFVVGENALKTPVGGPGVMKSQLECLPEIRGVRIQILPTDAEESVWTVGAFRILPYADRGPSAYAESAVGGSIVFDVDEV